MFSSSSSSSSPLFPLPGGHGPDLPFDDAALPGAPGPGPRGKVNPYSVIDITPLQVQQLEQQPRGSAPSSPPGSTPSSPSGTAPSSRPDPLERAALAPGAAAAAETQEGIGGPRDVSPGYAIPVPCGYATPSGVPLITPTYTTPVIIRHLSMDEEGTGSDPRPALLAASGLWPVKDLGGSG